MKKQILFLLATILTACFLSLPAHAGHIGEFSRTIYIEVNCDHCEDDPHREITIQLFADGAPVPDTEVTLNNSTGFTTRYDDLPIFRTEKGPEEIKYETGVKQDNGNFKVMPIKSLTYETQTIDKWVSVMPDQLEEGHDYVLLTENWNYEQNLQGKYVLVAGDMSLEQTTPQAEFEIIDGMNSYYSLATEPSDNAIWSLSRVNPTDPDFTLYPNAWQLTNSVGKKLVLSDFIYDDYDDIIWRFSSKNGYNASENSLNTNKLTFTPITENRGRFRLSAKLNDGDALLDPEYYLGINHTYATQAQTEPDYAAQFIIFEHITREVQIAADMTIEADLCPPDNPGTLDLIKYFKVGLIACVAGVLVIARKRR